MAFIAYHFHWSREEIMGLEHHERRTWCKQISGFNRKMNGDPKNIFDV